MADFSGVLAGLSVSAGVSAIIGAGALMAAPGFARWLTNKVSTFFSDDEDLGDEDHGSEPEDYAGCTGCGWNSYDDGWYGSEESGRCPQCDEEV